MSAPTIAGPVPVVSWDATEEEWLSSRSGGLGGSDISAVLGFSPYETPWDVWAEKTGQRHAEHAQSTAAQLGVSLEPWLLAQATHLLGVPASRTEHRTYAHPEYPWRRCSPDGMVLVDGRLVECKTAGLASGFNTPHGWADGAVPLGYEFQCRWAMHVMDAPAVEVIALVAGLGLSHRTVQRDTAIEHDLVGQVSDWYQRHILDGTEPPMGPGDAQTLSYRFPRSNGTDITLGDDAVLLWAAYREARDRETAAKADKDAAGAGLKALLGAHERGLVDGRPIATWGEKKGAVDWPRIVADLATTAGLPAPDTERYRKPPTRALSVKD